MFCNISGIFKIFRRCCSVSEDIGIDQNNLEHELAAYYIVFSGELLYNKAWDYYELDKETYKDAYRREFICAQRFAEFCKNEILVDFFEQRAKKYLN